ncbi:MAG: hypothetical protein ABL984_16250 [Pyrinomonadaceae bacterium]
MTKLLLLAILSSLYFFSTFTGDSLVPFAEPQAPVTSTYEKLAAASGTATLNIDIAGLSGAEFSEPAYSSTTFRAGTDSFFTAIATDEEFRGLLPSSLPLILEGNSAVPGKLGQSLGQLIVDSSPFGSHYSLVIRDAKTGFAFFNVEGHEFIYQPHGHFLSIKGGRLLLSEDYARELGRKDAGRVVGELSLELSMRPIEVTKVVDGAVVSDTLPASPNAGTVPGPDVVVGDLNGLFQPSGTVVGTQVGLAVGTDSCNFGTVDLNWNALPNNDHPVIPQNMYRMSGGANSDERFEQIGQSHVKHGFTALTENICSLGCNGVGGSRLGSGCSDPYSAGLNAGPNLGSRAWINPFTGAFPSGGTGPAAYAANNHTGHGHNQKSHRILTEIADLTPSLNPGATYYAESQYITPHEYTWCQANPTQCNMYNNVSYRRYNITSAGSPFSFSPAASTVRAKPAISAWPGATLMEFSPEPGVDGIGFVGYKVTNPSAGVWRYEYAVYNQNLDRAIRMFSIPIGSGASVSGIGFHAPPQHPGWAFDGTNSDAGYGSAPWTPTQNAVSLSWATETLAQNPNANAIRWGTMYNFRFESNRPPQAVNATVGFFKNGLPITVAVRGPSAAASVNITVSGRVATTNRALSYGKVTLTDSQGQSRVAYTNTFGYFRFSNVLSNQTYTVSVVKRHYTFAPQQITPASDLTNMSFFAPRDP